MFSGEITIKYEDYNFDLTAATYNFSWFYDGEHLKIIIDFNPTIAIVRKKNHVSLLIEVFGRNSLSRGQIIDLLAYLLGISEDLGDFYRLWSKDKLLGKSYGKLCGFRVRATPLWISLLIGICQQNASFKQGWGMLANLFKLFGKRVNLGNYGYTILPPTPDDIAKLGVYKLKMARVGYRANIILEIADAFIRGELSNDFNQVFNVDNLIKLRGIGNYTARLASVLTYRRYVDPPIDRWMMKIISFVYGVSEKESEDFWRRKWDRWGGLASLITTIALDAEVLSKAIRRIELGYTYPNESIMSPLTLWKYI